MIEKLVDNSSLFMLVDDVILESWYAYSHLVGCPDDKNFISSHVWVDGKFAIIDNLGAYFVLGLKAIISMSQPINIIFFW